jgi:hypothetical protein
VCSLCAQIRRMEIVFEIHSCFVYNIEDVVSTYEK